jgi:copper chaperone CopZ
MALAEHPPRHAVEPPDVDPGSQGRDRAAQRTMRRARRRAIHAFRPQRRLPAVVAAVVVAAAGALACAEAISRIADRPLGLIPLDAAADTLQALTWDTPQALAGAAALAVVGLVLIAAAVLPGRGGYVALTTSDPEVVVGMSTTGLRRALAAAVGEVDGVSGARVTLRRRRAKVVADTRVRADPQLRDAVRAAAEQAVDHLAPAHRIKVRARVRYGRR